MDYEYKTLDFSATNESEPQAPTRESVGINVFPFLVELALVLLFVVQLLRKYISFKRTPLWIFVIASIGYALAFMLTCLMPLDIAMSHYNYCVNQHDGDTSACTLPFNYVDKSILKIIWSVIYWVMFIATWVVYPLGQSYVYTGEFTFWRKLKAAFRDNLIFYAIAGAVGLIFLIILFFIQGRNIGSTISVAITLANSWGLFLLVMFMGVGLVEVPRTSWRKGNLVIQLRHQYFKAATGFDELTKAHDELLSVQKAIRKLDEIVPLHDENRRYVDKLVLECPPEYHMLESGEGQVKGDYNTIVDLRARLRTALHNWNQANALYEATLQTAFKLDDVIQSREYNIKYAIKWTYTAPRQLFWRPLTRFVNFVEWLWWTYLYEWFWRVLSIVLAAVSLILIYCEVTMFVVFLEKEGDAHSLPPTISPLTLLVRVPSMTAFDLEIISLCVIAYMATCTFSSLFSFRFLNWYRLLPNQQTDPYSILFCAAYLSRLSPPLVLNFLYLINYDRKEYDAAYIEVMGPMIKVPFFGERFNIIFPILILVVAVATLFSCWSRFLSLWPCCKYRSFNFEEWGDEELVDTGRELVRKERDSKRRALAAQLLAEDPNAVIDLESPSHIDEMERKRRLREKIRSQMRGKQETSAATTKRIERIDTDDNFESRLSSWFGRTSTEPSNARPADIPTTNRTAYASSSHRVVTPTITESSSRRQTRTNQRGIQLKPSSGSDESDDDSFLHEDWRGTL